MIRGRHWSEPFFDPAVGAVRSDGRVFFRWQRRDSATLCVFVVTFAIAASRRKREDPMHEIETLEGKFTDAGGRRFGLLLARFNSLVVERLLEGAVDTLRRHGVADDNMTIARVPGAFELPLAARTMAGSGRYDAIIALGCVIRGSTPHFDYVAGEAAKGLAQVQMEADLPISFGVLTTDSIEQAIERAGTKAGNKGADAAMGAIEMVSLMPRLRTGA